jgi:hypothetical protein
LPRIAALQRNVSRPALTFEAKWRQPSTLPQSVDRVAAPTREDQQEETEAEEYRQSSTIARRWIADRVRHRFRTARASISRGMQTDVAYALWSAIGTAAIVLIAVLFLGSPVSVAKVVGVGLIIAGVLTLNLAGAH